MRHKVGSALQFIGGGISRAAVTAIFVGIFFLIAGVTPWQAVAHFLQNPPSFLGSIWFNPGLTIVGLVIIGLSLWVNLWSKKQQAIDDLAEEMSWAIHDLVNRTPRPSSDEEIAKWEADYRKWDERVSKKLENRAFFTRADQLHFDGLGFIEPVAMSGHQHFDRLLSQLRLKFERLRDVINWTQQRRR
jgi:hypothetical protein